MLEIDKKASGMMILSLLLSIRSFADAAHLTGHHPRDVYTFIQDNIANYFENASYTKEHDNGTVEKVPFNKDRVLSLFSEKRSISKGALMLWSYGEGSHSRHFALVERSILRTLFI